MNDQITPEAALARIFESDGPDAAFGDDPYAPNHALGAKFSWLPPAFVWKYGKTPTDNCDVLAAREFLRHLYHDYQQAVR